MGEKNIYIVGFMGTGKTTVGRLLAEKLGREFIEMDDEIEKREGMKIVSIFATKGEEYFRTVESEVLKDIAQKSNIVVSCGGGVVLKEENMKILKNTGIVICLRASRDTIYERTKNDSFRPLLNVTNPRRRIEELLKAREPFYSKAHHTVDTDSLSPEEVRDRILAIVGF